MLIKRTRGRRGQGCGQRGCRSLRGQLPFDFSRGTIKESKFMPRERNRVLRENGKYETKNNCKTPNCPPEEPDAGSDAGRPRHAVRGAASAGAGLCAGRLGVEGAARSAVRAVRLRQLCAGGGGLLSGGALHPGRGSAAPHPETGAGAALCQRNGHRLFRPADRCSGGGDDCGLLPERRERAAGRRRTGGSAGRQSAAALRQTGGELHHGGVGSLRQPVHFRHHPGRVVAVALRCGRRRPRKGRGGLRTERRPPRRASGRKAGRTGSRRRV